MKNRVHALNARSKTAPSNATLPLLLAFFALLVLFAKNAPDADAQETPASAAGAPPTALPVEDPAEQKAFDKSVRRRRFPWYSSNEKRVVYLPPNDRMPRSFGPSSEPVGEPPLRFLSAVFVGLIVVLIALLIWALWIQYLNRGPEKKEIDEKANRARRLETLAPEARVRIDDLGAAARDAFERGDYRAALVFYFSWLLVEADKRRLILMNKGKTNREYWFELASNKDAQTIYRDVTVAFERVYFGDRPIDRAEFEAVWKLREPFEAILRQKDAEEAERLTAANAAPPLGRATSFEKTPRRSPPSKSFFFVLAVGTSAALSGCREPRWSDEYVDSSQYARSQSVDSVSVFADYCKTKAKRVEYERNLWFLEGEKYETIVWFYRDYGAEFYLSSDESGRTVERTAAENAFLTTKKNLADVGVDAICAFAEPAENSAFESLRPEIERWLKAKPNRTFVFVPNGWRSDVDFWTAFQESVPQDAPEVEKKNVENRLKDALERRERFAETSFFNWTDSLAALREELKENRRIADALNNSPRAQSFAAFPSAVRALQIAIKATAGEVESARTIAENRAKIVDRLARFQAQIEANAAPFDEASFQKIAFERAFERALIENSNADLCDSIFDDPEIDGGCGAPDCRFRYPWNASIGAGDFGDGDSEEPDSGAASPEKDAPWFRVALLPKAKRLERFSGAADWTRGLPPTKEYWATRTLEPLGDASKTLLAVDAEPFVVRRKVGESQFFALSSPAFLLNFSLLDPTNRVLTARLTDEFNPKGRAFVFVGSALLFAGDEEAEEAEEAISPFSLSRLTPFSTLVWSLIALATSIVCWRFPIFGRPKRNQREKTNDFGKHVDAFAFLLERADARRWARNEIETFRAARDAGPFFAEPEIDADSPK